MTAMAVPEVKLESGSAPRRRSRAQRLTGPFHREISVVLASGYSDNAAGVLFAQGARGSAAVAVRRVPTGLLGRASTIGAYRAYCCGGCPFDAETPPSTATFAPVMKLASSLARAATSRRP
jgi:hypothetical protein